MTQLTVSNSSPEAVQAMAQYKKLSNNLRSYLKGKGYHNALKALSFAAQYHTGFRKDGVTPEFQHQIEIGLFITTLKEVDNEEACIVTAMLHDVREDYDIEDSVIREKFGDEVADAVEKLTKVFKGNKKNIVTYFNEIANCPISSIVKCSDRINNVSSMVGVFTIAKQEEYLYEIKEYFIPMAKKARANFPEQLMSYYSMGAFLKTMSKTIEAVLKAEKTLVAANNTLNDDYCPKMAMK